MVTTMTDEDDHNNEGGDEGEGKTMATTLSMVVAMETKATKTTMTRSLATTISDEDE